MRIQEKRSDDQISSLASPTTYLTPFLVAPPLPTPHPHRMTVPLAVAGAFHTDFMEPAVSKLADVLKDVDIKKPRIPVISNVDAKPHSDPEVIKKILTTQVTSPVLWENTCASVLQRGFEQGFELGPGKVVAGIMKRIDKKVKIINVEV